MTLRHAMYRISNTTAAKRESRRQFAVNLVFFIFILSLIEGPLRKWFLPGLSGPLTLLRDPFSLGLYVYCLVHGLLLTKGIAALWLGFAVITAVVGLVQYAAEGFPVWGWALGVRTYWLYMPLAFVVAKTFTQKDLYRFIRLSLWITIPYAALVAAQYNTPSFSILNRGVGGDIEASVGVADGILRPFGLFTFTGQNVLFTAFMISVLLAFYVGQVPIRQRRLFLVTACMAVGVMSVLTGSRQIVFLAAIILSLTFFGLLATRLTGSNLRRVFGILGFVGLSAALVTFVFPDMFDAMVIRFEQASTSEGSIWNRVLDELTPWVDSLFTSSLLGGGIGAGSSAMSGLLSLPYMVYGESDLQRNVHELGVFLGVGMLLLRFGTSIWVVWLGVRLARNRLILAMPFAAFSSVNILIGAITNSPLSAYLVWLSLGIILSIREVERKI
jgi:hypothetical protein